MRGLNKVQTITQGSISQFAIHVDAGLSGESEPEASMQDAVTIESTSLEQSADDREETEDGRLGEGSLA